MTASSPAAFAPLSASPLWELQRAYFEAQGPRAWSSGTVPHYVTSHPYMARAFAEVIGGYAADCARAGGPSGERTLHIVELGAGTGRLGFQVTRALRAACDLAAAGWRAVYVMTDLAESIVGWWQRHPWLAPLVDAGLLDFARFDATADDRLTLRVSGRELSPARPAEHLVVIANYVFDSLPQDVFAASGGALHECLAAAPGLAADPAGGGFSCARLEWRARPAAAAHYGDPIHDRVLESYASADGVFSFPCGALGALDRLRAIGGGRALVLSADKGGIRLADVVADEPPVAVTHGSVSMSVNYHAVGQWALAHHGSWMHTEHRGELEVCAFVVGLDDRRGTLAAFDRAIAQRGPDDFYALKRLLVARAGELTLSELLAYLRLSGHDAKVFLDCAPAFLAAAATADPSAREDLARAITRVWDGYLPIGEDRDVPAALAELSTLLGRFADAQQYLAASRALHGEPRRRHRRPPAPARPPAPVIEDPFDVFTARAAGIATASGG